MPPPIDHPFLFHLLGGLLRFFFLFGGAFFLLWYYLKHSRKQSSSPIVPDGPKIILPLRLQACERFVLFLERIHPANLLMRVNNPELTSMQLQSLLVRTIREEFEYNLSQQLYVPSHAWELIRNAKEQTIHMINQASGKVGADAPSAELVRQILAINVNKEKSPVDLALEEIKKEVQALF